MDNQYSQDHITIYDRPSPRLRRVAFTVRVDDGVYVIKKRWITRVGRDHKSLYYKVQTADGRVGWIGPMLRLP